MNAAPVPGPWVEPPQSAERMNARPIKLRRIARRRKGGWLFPALLWAACLLGDPGPARGAEPPPDSLAYQARRLVEEGHTDRALELLNRALEKNPGLARARLQRGRLYLELGLWNEAERDFNQAAFSADPLVKAEAHLGLGDLYTRLPFRKLKAAAEYRQALQADPESREALYSLARTGFALRETQGYRLAARALVKLICLDPGYRDAYRLWRDKILDQSADELRETDACLEDYLAAHPDTALWRFDLAGDCFRLGEIGQALERLKSLDSLSPEKKLTERRLLEARCLLTQSDTLGFELAYRQALEAAGRSDDFAEIELEAETIFTPEQSEVYGKLKSANDRSAFWRKFWLEKDPDPLTPHNERLVTHYLRLQEAQKYYRMQFPHSLFQSSRDYHRLVSPVSIASDYDPDLFFNRSRKLTLDQRGLFFIRHGAPDRRTHQVTWSDPMEVWYYGSVHFLFQKKFGAGDYIFMPTITRGSGDINKAMAGDSFNDPLPALELDFYSADFRGESDKILAEFYQSTAVEPGTQTRSLGAELGVFDTTWAGVARDSAQGERFVAGRDTLWIAANRLEIAPGKYKFVLRLDVPDRRAVERGELELRPFRENKLDLSGIVLGSLTAGGVNSPFQKNTALLPRPSLQFLSGESIAVYLEIYGLSLRVNELRSFRERVTVSRTAEAGSSFWKSLGRLFGAGGKTGKTSLTLTFDRGPESVQGTVPENFTIDTANLEPGPYRVLIEVRDNLNGLRRERTLEVEILPEIK